MLHRRGPMVAGVRSATHRAPVASTRPSSARRPLTVAVNGFFGFANGTTSTLSLAKQHKQDEVVFTIESEEFTERRPTQLPVRPAAPTNTQHKVRTRTPIMAGNWKMNPTTRKEAMELAALVASAARTSAQDKPGFNMEVIAIPPFPYLDLVSQALTGSVAQLGAQDVHPAAKGAFTGAVAPGMLSTLGVSYVLAGHSERRVVFGENDADVNAKVKAILAAGMRAILCIGESQEEYGAGLAKQVCSTQLKGGLAGVTPADMERVVIAYEPVWAIGTGLTATPAIAQNVHFAIRSMLADLYGEGVAQKVRIQYGGSVTPETVDDPMCCPDIDGCLIGGASLSAEKFARIFSFHESTEGPTRLFAHEAVACGCTLGESIVWSGTQQRLFWVDSVGCALWSWDQKGKPLRWCTPEVLGCVALQSNGDLLLGLQSGLFSFSTDDGRAVKITDFEPGLDTRPNDGRVDREGNFVVGSYNNAHRQNGAEIGGLWRLRPDGGMREILDYKFRCSNCVCFSPEGETMYFTDTPTRRIFAFDYTSGGSLSTRRLVWEMPAGMTGGPDGAQTDARGFLWVCLSGASQVLCLDPSDGRVDAVVELPVTSPTCCTIGGPDLDTLFITSRGPDGGALFAVKLPDGVRGNPEPQFRGGAPRAAAVANGMHDTHAAGASATVPAALRSAQFCVHCGARHTAPAAKFCAECGSARR
ncbi:hypothetical protein FOA52_004200 [Chlamydomonas sp. UWO 241]|nr:hypothetical protein FOA52_004200 [Chlamydomonas sp. UWO 241]